MRFLRFYAAFPLIGVLSWGAIICGEAAERLWDWAARDRAMGQYTG